MSRIGRRLFFANEVATTFRAHLGGVDGVGGDVESLAGFERLRFSLGSYGHLSVQDDMGGGLRVGMIGIEGVGSVSPDRKSTRLNSSHIQKSRMPSSA